MMGSFLMSVVKVFFMFLIAVFIPGAAMAQEGVVILFEMSKEHVSLHEPIFVEFSIYNGLMEKVQFDTGHNEKSNFEFTITEPDGSIIRVPRLSEWGFGSIGRFSLESKKTYTQRLLLNEWYQMTKPGNYKVEVSLYSPIRTESNTLLNPKQADILQIEVRPRDTEKLKQVCEKFAKAAIESAPLDKRTDAAHVLSYIQDEIAIPYLERILKNKWVDRYGVTGLGRIATDKAIEILISVLEIQDIELTSLAHFTLSEAQESIKDPKLKKKVIKLLKP